MLLTGHTQLMPREQTWNWRRRSCFLWTRLNSFIVPSRDVLSRCSSITNNPVTSFLCELLISVHEPKPYSHDPSL